MNNEFQFVGYVGNEVETISFDSGNLMSKFSLAVDDSYKDDQGQTVKVVDWFNIKCWNKLAEIAEQRISKGDRLLIKGKVKNRTYEKEGVIVYATEFIALNILFLTPKK